MTVTGKKMIGVVGGCGPYAGLQMVRNIFDQTNAGKDQEHLPVYLSSVPGEIADRTEFLTGRTAVNPGHAIASIICQMEKVGVDVAGIACNTSHAPRIYDVICQDMARAGCRIKLLHIVDETISFIKEAFPDISRVGILSSDGTYKTGLYETRLAEAGYSVVQPDPDFQHRYIHMSIYNPEYGIKSCSSPVTARAKESIRHAGEFFLAGGAELIILGCTEFSLAVAGAEFMGMQVVDSVKVLAGALIRETNPEKLIPVPVPAFARL